MIKVPGNPLNPFFPRWQCMLIFHQTCSRIVNIIVAKYAVKIVLLLLESDVGAVQLHLSEVTKKIHLYQNGACS